MTDVANHPSTELHPDALLALDKAHLWHPYTEMGRYIHSATPLVVVAAKGARLFDPSGRSYLDGNASWWTSLLGHGHPRLVSALTRQAQTLAHVSLAGIVHESAVQLASELVAIAPQGLDRVFFSDDGSTALEVAVKMAVQYFHQNGEPQRRLFLALDGGFHGETLACTSLGGIREFRGPFGRIVMETMHVASPTVDLDAALADLEQTLREHGSQTAALVVEPIVLGCAGMRVYPPQYLREARKLTRQAGVLLIVDEVFTGYGRTGPFWACELANVTPDMLCTAKGFSGGMLPMAATLVTEAIFQGFLGSSQRAFLYGHTYCGNPLGAAVAREVLRIYKDESILASAEAKAQRIASCFDTLAETPGIRRTRHLGMIGALDLMGAEGYGATAGWRVYEEALRRGAYLRPLGNVVYVCPALNIPDSDLDELLSILTESVRLVGEELIE